MDDDFEYYKVSRSNSILLRPDKGNPYYLYEDFKIANPLMMKYTLQDPLPKRYKLVDYHSDSDSIVSKKIFNVLSSLNVYGLQLLPTQIRLMNDEVQSGYWAIHLFNHIKCVDIKNSKCRFDVGLREVRKLVLDNMILKNIPIEKRLAFRLVEDISYQLFHKSIVKKILATNPEGILFTNVSEIGRENDAD